MADVSDFTIDELAKFFAERGICEEIIENFRKNQISGRVFLVLTEEDLKELVPIIGQRAEIRALLKASKVTNKSNTSDDDPSQRRVLPSSSNYKENIPAQEIILMRQSDVSTNPCSWHHSFKIPEFQNFSGSVKQAIDTGIVTSKARREIIQTLRTLLLQHSRQLTPEQYVTVCQKLVTKFPKLRDTIGSNGFGSWKLALRYSFKNFRKSHPLSDSGNSESIRRVRDTIDGPPSKRRKTIQDEEDTVECDKDEYEQAVAKLKDEWKKGRKFRSQATIKELMEKTTTLRRRWIETQRPLVSDILSKFPCLSQSRTIRREFQALLKLDEGAGTLKQLWPEWAEKILAMGRMESANRPGVNRRLLDLDMDEHLDCKDDHYDAVTVDILMKLLYTRGPSKGGLFILNFETCDVDIEQAVSEDKQAEPFIAVTGMPGAESTQYFIICENAILLESKSLRDAFVDLIASYYVFDIAYPKSVAAILLFFQHIVFNLNDQQPHPTTLTKLIQNIDALYKSHD